MRWAEARLVLLEFPAEIDRALVLYARDVRLTRGKLETLCAALKRDLPGLKGSMDWAESTIKNKLKLLELTVEVN